jgi:hypothetical protein
MLKAPLGLMNNTKWEEIRIGMLELQYPVRWRTRSLKTGHVSSWDADWYYHFRLLDNIVTEKSYPLIEWLEIDLSHDKEEILAILKKIHIPGILMENSVKIIGYSKGEPYEYL